MFLPTSHRTQRILLEQQAKKKQPLQHASGAADDEPGTLSGEIVTAAADPSVDGQNPFSAATEVTLDSMRPVRQENPMRDTSDTVQPTSGGDGGGEGAAGEVSMAASVAKGGGSAQALGAAPPGAVVHLPSAFSVRKGLFHPQLMWASPRNSTGTSPAPAEQTRKASVDAGQHRGAAQTTVAKPHAHTGKKKLQERGAASYVFLAPLIIWGMSTIASFAASYHLLFTTIDFVHQIRTAATTWQLGARVHHYAQARVRHTAPAPSPGLQHLIRSAPLRRLCLASFFCPLRRSSSLFVRCPTCQKMSRLQRRISRLSLTTSISITTVRGRKTPACLDAF